MTTSMKDSRDAEIISRLLNVMEIKISQLTGSKDLQQQIGHLSAENQRLHQELTRVGEATKRVPMLEERLKKLEAMGSEGLIVEKQNLELKIQEVSHRVQVMKQQVDQLNVERQAKNNLAFQYKIKEMELKKVLKKERETIQEWRDKNQELKRTLRRLQRRLLRGGRLRHSQIQVDEELIETGPEGQAEGAMREQVLALKEAINLREMKIQDLQLKNQTLVNQLAKSPARDLKLKVQALQKEVDQRQGKIIQFESERKKLDQQISMLQARITDLQVSFQEQSRIITERSKKVQDLETTLRTGIQSKDAREIIVGLQEEAKDLREQIRGLERDVRILDRNAFSFKQQLDQSRTQAQALFRKNRELLLQLQHGGQVSVAARGSDMLDDVSEIETEMRDKDRKVTQLEQKVKNLGKEVEKLNFNMHSRDVKVEELNRIIDEFKVVISKANIKMGVSKKK